MEAVILAGGLGTRLRNRISDIPKVLAPVEGKPFIGYVLDALGLSGVRRVVLAVGYLADSVISAIGDSYHGIKIEYSREESPLGTGGAVKKALSLCGDGAVFVLNGDTVFDVDLPGMLRFHTARRERITIAVKPMEHFDRYGSVTVEDGRVTSFREKAPTEKGLINGGVYLLERGIFDGVGEESFSFERRILQSGDFAVGAFESRGYFIDMGIPEDYDRACADLAASRRSGMGKAAFLDRDGTLNVECGHLYRSEDFEFIPGTPRAIEALHAKGYRVIVVTNQAGIAKGLYSAADVERLHLYIDSLLEREGTYIDAYCFCPHHPEGIVPEYRGQCSCRKPAPGLIEAAVRDFAARGETIDLASSVMIGDTQKDIQTARNAGVGTAVAVHSGHPFDGAGADLVAETLYDAVGLL